MARFPNKTPYELRQYFKQLDLAQLIKINQDYGPHFISLEDRLDHHRETLRVAEERLAKLRQDKESLESKYDQVAEEEAGYQKTLQGVLCDTDHTDRFLGRQAAGYSPLASFELKSRYIYTELSQAAERVNGLNRIIENLEQRKTAAISELKILNKVIEEKRNVFAAEQIQTSKPS
ncbi:hypothetical protein [Legionella sp. WA2022007384]